MSFNIKGMYSPSSLIVLQYIRLIESTDAAPLLSIQQDYQALKSYSSSIERATCTLIASILLQERLYYLKTREGFRSIMKRDANLVANFKTFSDREWAKILSTWYSNGIIELVSKGDRNNAGVYKVVHPVIVEYLNTKVDATKQLNEVLESSEAYRLKT